MVVVGGGSRCLLLLCVCVFVCVVGGGWVAVVVVAELRDHCGGGRPSAGRQHAEALTLMCWVVGVILVPLRNGDTVGTGHMCWNLWKHSEVEDHAKARTGSRSGTGELRRTLAT